MEIKVAVKDTILRPIAQVFDCIVSPTKISKFFTSDVRGSFEQEQTLTWVFEDVGVELEVKVQKLVTNELISFQWEASGQPANVDIMLTSVSNTQTNIAITEAIFKNDEIGVKRALQQTQGWTDFICSMKAYLYANINLRSGRTHQSK